MYWLLPHKAIYRFRVLYFWGLLFSYKEAQVVSRLGEILAYPLRYNLYNIYLLIHIIRDIIS